MYVSSVHTTLTYLRHWVDVVILPLMVQVDVNTHRCHKYHSFGWFGHWTYKYPGWPIQCYEWSTNQRPTIMEFICKCCEYGHKWICYESHSWYTEWRVAIHGNQHQTSQATKNQAYKIVVTVVLFRIDTNSTSRFGILVWTFAFWNVIMPKNLCWSNHDVIMISCEKFVFHAEFTNAHRYPSIAQPHDVMLY